MRLETTYLNARVELLEGVYAEERHDQLRASLRLYNRVLGPVTTVSLLRPELLDLSMYGAHCDHVPVTSLLREVTLKSGPYAGRVPGGGKGATPLGALLGAWAEISERLLAIIHWEALSKQVEYGSYDELVRRGRHALAPQIVPLFAPEQYASTKFEYAPFRPDTFLGWVEGRELLTGRPILVPAQLVLMYYRPHPAEQDISHSTTAGLAFHTSRREAILHGLYEVIERDALNVRWYSKLPPPRVDVDLSAVLADELDVPRSRMSTPYVDEPSIFLMTLDLPPPALAAIAIDRSRQERAFMGGTGAAAQRERGLAQALFEVGQSQTGLRLENPFGRPPIYADSGLEDVIQFHDAPLYYGHARNLPRTSWFAASEEVIAWDEVPTLRFDAPADEYDGALEWVRSAGLDPIVLDFDSACWPGMSITKVFVPQLTQACPPRNPTLGHPRFYELPVRLGKAARPLRFEDLNPDPIPFP